MNWKPIALMLLTGIFIWQGCKSDEDNDLPYILLDGDNPYYINNIGGTFIEPGFSAVDDIDGDLTSKVIVSYPTIQTDSAKIYEAVYTVSDAAGNVFTTKRQIEVRSSSYFLSGFFSFCRQTRNDTLIDSLFSASVVPSLVSNDQIYITNFGNLGYGMDVLATVDTINKKLVINTPQLLADSSTLDSVNPDSTYYVLSDSLRFQIFFTHSKNGNSEARQTYYSK